MERKQFTVAENCRQAYNAAELFPLPAGDSRYVNFSKGRGSYAEQRLLPT